MRGVNLRIEKGELVGVCGRVGSGKTTLVSAILGHVRRDAGSCRTAAGAHGYVPQSAFVLSGTVEENIVMGRGRDAAELARAVRAAAFEEDLARMPGGLGLEVGERGQTLSGGQKQRLAVARAVYGAPALLVADDPLAAVDGRVAAAIFERALEGRRARGLTTVVVLNQLHFLPRCDRVVFMGTGGVEAQGPFEELKRTSPAFARFVAASSNVHDLDAVDGAPATRASVGASVGGAGRRWSLLPRISRGGGDSGSSEEFESWGPHSPGWPAHIRAMATAKTGGKIDNGGATKGSATTTTTSTTTPPKKLNHLRRGSVLRMSAKAMMPSSQLAHRLTMKETKRTGTTVSRDVVREYMAALGPAYVPVCVALGLVAYGLMAATDLWLAGWITAAGEGEGAAADRAKAYGYIGLAVAQVAGILALSAWNAFSTNRASRELHRKCVGRILHAPVKWFEENPSGRILSRFSGDLSIVDRMFAFLVDDAWHFVWLIVGLCAVIAVIVPEMVAVLVAGLFLAALCVVAVDRTNREAKRETNMALSPILTTISETVHGRALLQSMGLQDFFCRRNYRNLDTFNGLNFFSCCVIQFGTLRINVLAFFITTATASLVLLRRDAFDDVALIGVALSYAFLLPYFMGIFMVIITQLMSGASSLERLLEYLTASLPQEAASTGSSRSPVSVTRTAAGSHARGADGGRLPPVRGKRSGSASPSPRQKRWYDTCSAAQLSSRKRGSPFGSRRMTTGR